MFHFNNKLPLTRLGKIGVICAGFCTMLAQADATLVYETLDAAGAKTQHTFSIMGRSVRIDTEPREQPGYSLFDSGRMVMFNVDEKTKTYKPVKAGEFWHPAIPLEQADSTQDSKVENTAPPDPAPTHTLKATKKKRTVAEKRCRVVLEMADDKQIAEHCMSGTAELGISDREMTTLSRLFTKADNLGLDLMGVATTDESYASIQSQRVDDKGKASQTLKSVTKTAIPTEKMRIAEDYKLIKPVVPKAQ